MPLARNNTLTEKDLQKMDNNKLHILWTNDNPVTAELMVMMYATNTMKYEKWENVTVIIWGATAKLVAEDIHNQHLIADAQEVGVGFTACAACADTLEVKENLLNLGIEVKGWGQPLTDLIKGKENLITV